MKCTTFDDLLNRLSADRYGILACFASVLIFTYSVSLVRWISGKLKALLLRRRERCKADERIEELAVKVKQTKTELDALSPTAQFAAYFKKDRILKQLTSELDGLVKERTTKSGLTSTALWITVGLLVQLIAMLLMLYSRNVIVGYINSSYFWPFNFFLYIPNLSAPVEQNENSDDNNDEATPVTLFALLSLIIFVWQSLPRTMNDSSKKQKMP